MSTLTSSEICPRRLAKRFARSSAIRSFVSKTPESEVKSLRSVFRMERGSAVLLANNLSLISCSDAFESILAFLAWSDSNLLSARLLTVVGTTRVADLSIFFYLRWHRFGVSQVEF